MKTIEPEVLYPSLVFQNFLNPVDPPIHDLLPSFKTLFLSINRFERKKNLSLALESLAYLKTQLSSDRFAHVHMVVAGGYDNANVENKEHYLELLRLVDELELSDKVTFLRSFSDSDKGEGYYDVAYTEATFGQTSASSSLNVKCHFPHS